MCPHTSQKAKIDGLCINRKFKVMTITKEILEKNRHCPFGGGRPDCPCEGKCAFGGVTPPQPAGREEFEAILNRLFLEFLDRPERLS